MTKSIASLEQHCCLVCTKLYDTGSVLVQSRNIDKPKLDMHTVNGWGLCPEHQGLYDQGYFALVGADPSKSETLPNGKSPVNGAHRTGKLVHVRRAFLPRLFTNPIPDEAPMAFVEDGIIDTLEQLEQERRDAEFTEDTHPPEPRRLH
jgi:hypothetical protein